MSAPVGRVVGLYVDTRQPIVVGDVIQTQTGRSYRVDRVRVQERGEHVGRQHLRAMVIDASSVVPEDHVIQIRWYSRKRRR